MDPLWRVVRRAGRHAWNAQELVVAVFGLITLAAAAVAGWRLGVGWGFVTALAGVLLLVLWTARDIQKDLDEHKAAQKPNVRLAPTSGAFITGDDEATTFWAELRATNHGEPSVLTDWTATLRLGDQSYTASHIPHARPSEHMHKRPSLDLLTATTPLTGEINGWVPFWVRLPKSEVMGYAERGERFEVHVEVQDKNGATLAAVIDVTALYQASHNDLDFGKFSSSP